MSDLCITRAWATSLAEICILNKPFIAIPLPSAKDNHQMKNAQFYEEMGCCWVLDQRNLKKEKLLNIILNILKDKSDLMKALEMDVDWIALSFVQQLDDIIKLKDLVNNKALIM